MKFQTLVLSVVSLALAGNAPVRASDSCKSIANLYLALSEVYADGTLEKHRKQDLKLITADEGRCADMLEQLRESGTLSSDNMGPIEFTFLRKKLPAEFTSPIEYRYLTGSVRELANQLEVLGPYCPRSGCSF